MKVLIIGSGGREHALAWKLAQSPRVKHMYAIPGSDAMAQFAECVVMSQENLEGIAEFAQKHKVDLTVVGPEAPLANGLVDVFERNNMKVFGPRKRAAILESSKCFTKDFCDRHDIPTAQYRKFSTASEAKEGIEDYVTYPVVIKADGLAAGKGVVICHNKEEALKTIDQMMVHERYGDAGRQIVVEEFLQGEEASYMVVTDGENFVPLASSQDHKPVFDGNTGPNTGGMGAYSPAPLVTPEVEAKIHEKIIKPLLKGMSEEDRFYRGILYAGLMIEKGEPRVVEFNCRFGDPEAQVLLYRMKTDLVDLIEASLEGRLDSFQMNYDPRPAVCVVMCSEGYPGDYEKGKEIKGLENSLALEDTYVFHSGTKLKESQWTSSGGRVLGVTSRGNDLKGAIDLAYKAVNCISWDGVHFRRDIGLKGLGQSLI